MAMAPAPVIDSPTDEQEASTDAERARIENQTASHEGRTEDKHRQGVTERDRQEREIDRGPAVPVQAQRDREQPAHGRVETVERSDSASVSQGQYPVMALQAQG